ncbi:MAG: hypothetical protein ACTSQI_05785 [Candidatus Helarchaeota archaeon]
MAELHPRVTVQVLDIPTSLVLLGKTCSIFLQIQNHGPHSGDFKVIYVGAGLNINSSDLSNKLIQLNPNSSEIDRIELTPTQKGFISLNIKILYCKEIIKEVERYVAPPQPTSSDVTQLSTKTKSESSIFTKEFSPELAGALEEVLSGSEEPLPPIASEPLPPQKIIEKVKEIEEMEIYQSSLYLNVLDKESSKKLKEFAKKGDSNIFSTEMGMPLCICYFYSEIKDNKWKIRPALIRNTSIRLKEKGGKAIYYLSYPISKDFDEREGAIIKEALNTFILPRSLNSEPMLLLNLDIIPEFEKPSIIIGFEKSGIYSPLTNLLENLFGDSVDIFIDDCIFSGGLLYDCLTQWVGQSQVRVVNLILSNNFISDIKLFQTLLEALVSFSVGEL